MQCKYSSRMWNFLNLIAIFNIFLCVEGNVARPKSKIVISVEQVRNIVITEKSATEPIKILEARDLAKNVSINCKGSCPVQWYLRKYRYSKSREELAWLANSVKFSTKREFTDFWNNSTYIFSSTMTLSGSFNKLSGVYDCVCGDEDDKDANKESILVYWEGSTGSYLLQSGESVKIPFRGADESFRLYCGASKPKRKIFLYHNSVKLVPNNDTLVEDIDGFLVSNSILNGTKNEFICSLRSDLVINGAMDNSEKMLDTVARYKIEYTASNSASKKSIVLKHFRNLSEESDGLVNYDYQNHTLICCSLGRNHTQEGYYCTNHQECRYKSIQLDMMGNNAQDNNETCSWYNEGFAIQDGAVIFRCDSDKLTADAEKFYGFDSTSYHSIEEAEKEKGNLIKATIEHISNSNLQRLIRAMLEKVDFDGTNGFYKGSSITLQCRHSTYLFAEGIQWMLEYENGTKRIVLRHQNNSDYVVENIWISNPDFNHLKLKVHSMNITKVLCLGPVYNSYEWWNSTVDILIKESIEPHFENDKDEEIHVSVGDVVEMDCIAYGNPRPTIGWHKDSKAEMGTTLPSEDNSDLNATLLSTQSKLSFKMGADSTGTYICDATSVVGSARKKFVVKFRDYTTTAVILGTVAVIAILLIILLLSLYKIAQQRKAIRFLSRKEIEEFEKGNPEALEKLKSINEYSTNDAHHLLPYNTDYEVPKDRLIVDYGQILGQGTYGMVLKGKLRRGGDETDVAVKTIKPNEEASHFKVLLCEVKIMAYIGSHDNIVSLVGAFTRNIRNREILVATQFCEHGSLMELLRTGRSTYTDSYNNSGYQNSPSSQSALVLDHDYTNTKIAQLFTSSNLLKWAAEIATGMEYLGQKRVIHGDLACRNVLLGSDFQAKVGDFGLSKHLFQYSTYQKKTVQLLPWRWMAIESLTDMVFSLESDAWAYGVTLWEIFTLAQTPYPGLTWDEEFIKKLNEDYRLPKPMFATNEIYELILSCWVVDPKRRPKFPVLKQAFQALHFRLESQNYL